MTVLESLPSQQVGNSYVGSGVTVQGTKRIVDTFIVQSLWSQQSNLSQSDAYNNILKQIDLLFSDPSLGISEGLSTVFNSLQDVINDPGSIPARQIFITQNQMFQNIVNEIYTQIFAEFSDVNSQIVQDVNMINSLSQEIAAINFQIQNLANTNFASAPNELYDNRENLILTLAEYVGLTTSTQDNGAVNVFIGSGQALVINDQATVLTTIADPSNVINTNIAIIDSSYTQDITNFIQGGDIGGLLNIRNDVLPQALNSLGSIMISIAMALNEQHVQGLDLNGNLGVNIYNDPNDYNAMLGRAIESTNNTGSAVFGVSIDPISISNNISSVFSNASNIVNAGTLNPLIYGLLSINGVNVRSATAADDTVSTTDSLASAIAISNAINSQSSSNLVTAIPQPNVVYLGQFSPGALAAGNLTLNGVNIISTGVDEDTLLQDINTLSTQTGIIAVGDGNFNITLIAEDGRNIELAKTVNSTGATFTYFDLNAGGPFDNVVRANVKLVSQQDGSISIGGSSPSLVGFTSGTFPQTYSSLTTNDYQLFYDGSMYILTSLPDMAIVAQSATPSFSVDGFTLNLVSGTAAKGDIFSIIPTRYGARDFRLI